MKRENGSEPSVIGFICFRNVTEESELLNIGVHPHYRQKGIGKKLMQFYIDFCNPLESKHFILKSMLRITQRSISTSAFLTNPLG